MDTARKRPPARTRGGVEEVRLVYRGHGLYAGRPGTGSARHWLVAHAHGHEVGVHPDVAEHLLRTEPGRWTLAAPPLGFPLTPDVQPPGPKVLSAWVQYLGTARYVGDWTTANFDVHLDVLPNEVKILPFELCQKLIVSPLWIPQTVLPVGFAFSHDNTSGLDTAWLSSAAWGLPAFRLPFFEPDYGPGEDEASRLFLVAGQPYMDR